MAENSKIEWCDHTLNPWIGCSKISAGCDMCYAENMNNRYRWTEWGPHGVRKRTSEANWRKPFTWNRNAAQTGRRERVFCASLADVWDNKAPPGARKDLFGTIRNTPMLDWLLLTKRPENILRFLPDDWGDGYPNVWLGITAENQECYDRRWKRLREIPAAIRFISYEPALEPLTLTGFLDLPDWIIVGGESGPGARTMRPQWARDIVTECYTFDIPVFVKQWGTYGSNPIVIERGMSVEAAKEIDPPENGKGGALLDGMLIREYPATVV